MSISTRIEEIRKRPGLYLSSKGVTPLLDFITGYQIAKMDYRLHEKTRELIPLDFYQFMNEFAVFRLNPRIRNMGWRHAILEHLDGDEEKGLEKFFELYDEFKQIKMTRYWKAVLSEENVCWSNEHTRVISFPGGKEKPAFLNPMAAYVIELSVSAYILAIETMDEIILEPWFFTSPEKAMGGNKQRHPYGVESYFGKIDSWEEIQAENIIFEKNIR